jgi:hypothetical protein
MNSVRIFIETGQKRIFAGAVDWPGWCRSAQDEETALQTLADYAPRYAKVLQSGGIAFPVITIPSDLVVIERHAGNAATDFGSPAIVLDADRAPVERMELERLRAILLACWQAFDGAAQRSAGRELQKGPRGGGRELAEIVNHLIGADQAYLGKIAWKYKAESGKNPIEERDRIRQAILDAIEVAVNKGLPEQGPRGGTIWPVRYFIRRVAWHVLDHAWEIEDRMG